MYHFCFNFNLISISLDKQAMLVLILIDVQYSQKVVPSFEKGSVGKDQSPSVSNPSVKKFPPAKFQMLPHWGKFPLHTPYCYLENPMN